MVLERAAKLKDWRATERVGCTLFASLLSSLSPFERIKTRANSLEIEN